MTFNRYESPDYPSYLEKYEDVYKNWIKGIRSKIADECKQVIEDEIERLASYVLPFANDPNNPDYRKSNSLGRILDAIRGDK